MVTYALDASALLRYLDNEAGAGRVEEIIRGHLRRIHKTAVLAIHWGEVAGSVYRNYGHTMLAHVMSRLAGFDFDIVPITPERAVRAAILKADKKIPYVDAFGVEWASTSPDHVFVTGDFDLKAATPDVQIEFLPTK